MPLGQAQAGVGPDREPEGARGGELGPVLQRVGADRLVVLLGVAVAAGELAEPLDGSSMSVPSRVKSDDTLLAPTVRREVSRTLTGTQATSEVSGSSPRWWR